MPKSQPLRFFSRHPFFAAVICLQALCLFVCLIRCFRPVYSAEWAPEQLSSVQSTLAETAAPDGARALAPHQEAALQALSSDANAGTGVAWLQSESLALPAGLYQFSVAYACAGSDSGTLSCESFDGTSLCSSQTLSSGSESAAVRCWLSTGTSDIRCTVYVRDLSLSVASMTVQELPHWRFVCLGGVLLLFLLLDGLWLLLLPDGPFGLSPRRRVLLAALMGTVVLVSLPALSGFASYGIDLEFHLSRISGVASALRSGQFPVRIYPDLLNGYGYASPIFYGDLLLYLPALLYLLGLPLYAAYNFYVVLVNLLTAAIAFVCFFKMFRRDWLAGAGTILYLTASYRIFNLYYRPALGEYSAEIFFPLLLYGFWALLSSDAAPRQQKRAWLPLALGFTGVIQTHVISTEITAVFAALFCLCLAWRTFRPGALLTLAKGALCTILLNLWFLVPFFSFLGGNYRCTDSSELYDAGFYALSPTQMLTFWDSDMQNIRIGAALLLGALLYLFCRLFWQQLPQRESRLGLAALAGSAAAFFLSSALFPWSRLDDVLGVTAAHYLCAVQYPFRYLAILSLLLPVTAVCALAILHQKAGRRAAWICTVALCLLGCTLAWLDCGQYVYGTYGRARTADAAGLSDGSGASGLEYLPAAFDADINDTTLLPGYAQVEAVSRQPLSFTVTAANPTDSNTSIEFPLTYYPCYAVTSNSGGDLSVQVTEHETVAVVLAPGYSGTFTVAFREPRLWRLAELVSLLTAAALLFRLTPPGRRLLGKGERPL